MRYTTSLLALAGALLAACGGGQNAATRAPVQTGQRPTTESAPGGPGSTRAGGTAAVTMPSWMKVDQKAKTVSMDIEAGKTATNNHWNFNGYSNGDATITVPAGYKVTLDFTNHDPALAHSIGVDTRTGNFEATLTPQPAFANAVSPDPSNPAGGTQPGKSTKVTFVADKPGHYSLVCYMPGHAAAGMWAHFDVSSTSQAGVATGS